MAFDRSVFIKKFTTESKENIQKLNEGLINLEKNPEDQELIQELFRAAHTVKGSSRMMSFKQTNRVTHKIEDLFGLVREGKLRLSEDHYDLLFEALDIIKALLDEIDASNEESSDVENIVIRLETAVEGGDFKNLAVAATTDELGAVEAEPEVAGVVDEEPTAPPALAESPDEPTPKPVMAKPVPKEMKTEAKKPGETIRVDMETLDQTIKSVGELMVGRMRSRKILQRLNELKQNSKVLLKILSENRKFWEDIEEANVWEVFFDQCMELSEGLEDLHKRDRESTALQDKIISELEQHAFQMRMMPLGTIFGAYPRITRDISKEMGKKIELIIHGEETQLDKKMIEKLDSPLMHILRNCADHGIESPDARVAKGKPEKGTIHLTAYNESGSVVIEIQDDGNGIDVGAVREKALQKHLIDEAEISKLSERDILDFIFRAGFSTSKIITDISGRGVGLDVVRKNVEDLRGNVIVDSEAGKGSRFVITLPLTLSALRILLVKVYGMTVALPVSSVRETLIVHKEEIISIVDREAIRLRNQIITLVKLGDVLRVPPTDFYEDKEQYFVVIGEVAKERVGFIIDDIIDEIEVVQKPLPVMLQSINNVSGVTILGDNELVLILYMADLISSSRNLRFSGAARHHFPDLEEQRQIEILVVDDSLNTREVEKSILEAHGFVVDLAKDGMDALKKTDKKRYDLIVTDVEMPRMDGFTLTKNLRQSEMYREVPIVIVTSRESDEDKRRGIEVGANAYIVKGSFDQNNLVDTIDSLIG